MLKLIKSLMLGAFVLGMISCSSDGNTSKERKLTTHGYEYEHHRVGDGITAALEEYVLYDYKIMIEDSIYQSTFGGMQSPRFQMPDAASVESNDSPIMDALAMMSKGDSMTIYYPVDSMKNNSLGLPAGAFIKYVVACHAIMDQESFQEFSENEQAEIKAKRDAIIAEGPIVKEIAELTLAKYKTGELDDELIETESGVKLLFHEKGSGANLKNNDIVFSHYYGLLVDNGEVFDNSFEKGVPFRFFLGKQMVIPAWDEAFLEIPRGSEVSMFIPYAMAYGEAGYPGHIPEKADLYFYIKCMERVK